MPDYPYHPLALEYPIGSKAELNRLAERIKRFGQRQSIYLWNGQIIDGRRRHMACMRAGIEPRFEDLSEWPEDQLPDLIQDLNEERRHLAEDWLEKRRAERVERVAAARQEGKSTRQIAEDEGISHTQVRRDLSAAPQVEHDVPPETNGDSSQVSTRLTPETPAPKVTGRDGKTYPASRGGGKGKKKAPAEPAAEALVDALGIPVPEKMHAAFALRKEFAAAAKHIRQAQVLLAEMAHKKGGEELRTHMERRQSGDGQKVSYRLKALADALYRVKFSQPHACVCPYCHHEHPGKVSAKCKPCLGLGWVNEATFKGSPEDYREAVEALVKKEGRK